MLAHFSNWEIEICLKNSGQTVVGSFDWYVDWALMKCVRDCDDDSSSNCGKTVSTFPFVNKRNERIKLTNLFLSIVFSSKVDLQVIGISFTLTHPIAVKDCGGLTRMKIVHIRSY